MTQVNAGSGSAKDYGLLPANREHEMMLAHRTEATVRTSYQPRAGLTSPKQNHLLDALPAEVQDRLSIHLERVYLPLGEVLYESEHASRYVYFPIDSIVSLHYVMENGESADFSVVGKEGFVGIATFLGGASTQSRATVVTAGYAHRLRGYWLDEELHRHSHLLLLLLRYAQSLITQASLIAVCNRHHSVDQQLARWLLTFLDRLSSNRVIMTQERIANMLGVRRESITVAAKRLHDLRAIEYSRGAITVLVRPILERVSCECYSVIKHETDRLLPCPHVSPTNHGRLNWRQEVPRPFHAAERNSMAAL